MAIVYLLCVLACLVMGGVSYFLWARAKTQPALLMMVGFGAACLGFLLIWIIPSTFNFSPYLFSIGLAVAAVGFFLTFQSQINAQLDELKSKVAGGGDGGGKDDDDDE